METIDQTNPQGPMPLFEAIEMDSESESVECVRNLLDAGEDPNGVDPEYGRTPLGEAWSSGRAQIVQMLLDAGADATSMGECDVELGLICAPIEVTKTILRAGFRFETLIDTLEFGEPMCIDFVNPLNYTFTRKPLEFFEQLLEFDLHCLFHAFDQLGDTPLHSMVREGDLEKARWLIEHGADVNSNCGRWVGFTPLDRAVHDSNLEMAQLLIDAGANPNIPTWMLCTAVDRAIEEMKDDERGIESHRSALNVHEAVLAASKLFPPPVYPK